MPPLLIMSTILNTLSKNLFPHWVDHAIDMQCCVDALIFKGISFPVCQITGWKCFLYFLLSTSYSLIGSSIINLSTQSYFSMSHSLYLNVVIWNLETKHFILPKHEIRQIYRSFILLSLHIVWKQNYCLIDLMIIILFQSGKNKYWIHWLV